MNTQEWPKQLKDACRLTGARWAAWLVLAQSGWVLGPRYALNKPREDYLTNFIQEKITSTWLGGALSSGRSRSRTMGSYADQMGCERIFLFPNPDANQIIMVGADKFEKTEAGLFRILATFPLPFTELDTIYDKETAEVPIFSEAGLEASYDPKSALDNILKFLTKLISCDSAYLAIRYGNLFHIESIINCPSMVRGYDIPLQEDIPLSTIVISQKGLIVEDISQEPRFALNNVLDRRFRAWMGIPIMIGQRVIGFVAFASAKPGTFDTETLETVSQKTGRLAYHVETAIIFSEAAHYMQQLALLNELASTASLAVDLDEFARRVMQRLRRLFDIDWSAILLLSSDGTTLQEFGGGSQMGPPWVIPIENSLMGSTVTTGSPARTGDLHSIPHHTIHPDLRSELAVPLKYRGLVIGTLVLVSTKVNAFSHQDEQLLQVIASHMAGLFENVRLNEETRERAQKLQDSVRQLQAIRETALDIAGDLDPDTLLKRIAQRARDLVGARGAEVGLLREDEDVVQIVVSETPWEKSQVNIVPLMAGVVGRLAAFGDPIKVSDYDSWKGKLSPDKSAPYRAIAGVPLKFRGNVIGTLTVMDDRIDREFNQEDLQLLELMAPQAAISIRNARLYQELQERIEAQQLAESRLIRSARLAAVGEMAAGVAHELNNPLTTVNGFVELVLEELPPDSPHRPDLELVMKEALRARGVVRRLLDFSRPVDDQRVRADVNELVTQVLALVNHLAHTSSVEIQMELDEELPWITIDTNQITQVIVNLVNNALQAMPDGGELLVRTGLESRDWGCDLHNWVTITICDTGEGVPDELLERIFEPFFTTRPEGMGTGLGLSVSYGIVSSHNGFIDVDSQETKGTCFTVYLPVTND
jgi:signal transduction histidine kinase